MLPIVGAVVSHVRLFFSPSSRHVGLGPEPSWRIPGLLHDVRRGLPGLPGQTGIRGCIRFPLLW